MFAIDANIFLELLLRQERFEIAKFFLQKVLSGETRAVVSDFTTNSILLVMERNGMNYGQLRSFLLSLLQYEGLKMYVQSVRDKLRATEFMKKYGLDFEDALTLQCALSAGCDMLVSFDKDFDRVKEIKRVLPQDV